MPKQSIQSKTKVFFQMESYVMYAEVQTVLPRIVLFIGMINQRLIFQMWCDMFNVGLAIQWAFTDGLGVNPKADPETVGLAILILRQVARLSLYQCTPKVDISNENKKWRKFPNSTRKEQNQNKNSAIWQLCYDSLHDNVENSGQRNFLHNGERKNMI